MKRVVGKVELGERCVGGVEFDGVGAENQPADEDDDSDDNENGDEDLAYAGADAVGDAAAAAAEGVATAAASSAARAVIGFGGRRDGGAVVGSVQVGLFISHWLKTWGAVCGVWNFWSSR